MEYFHGRKIKLIIQWVIIIIATVFFSITFADPPSRVARVSLVDASVSLLPNGESSWIEALINRPLMTGDRLWVAQDSKSELQFGSAALRLWSDTDLSILNIDNDIVQFGLNQGSVNLSVWQIKQNQQFEIDTPNLAFTTVQPGHFRINVDTENNTTTINVLSGQAVVYGENYSYVLEANQSYTFVGTDLSNYMISSLPASDDFDAWYESRDEYRATAVSSQYVAESVIGYEDLDHYGKWYSEPNYGNVWIPENVSNDWAPYRQGSWLWQEPWGWTWVDTQPWGFAPFHYGRWAYVNFRWAWIPGPIDVEPVYAPALVVFISGSNFQFNISLGNSINGIGWFPLGPGDVYIPPYVVTQNYFTQINISNTVINRQSLFQAYREQNLRHHYHNWNVANAMTAIPESSFVKGDRVPKVMLPIAKDKLQNIDVKDVKHKLDLKPLPVSLVGGAVPTRIKPPKADTAQHLIVKTAPVEWTQKSKPFNVDYKKIKEITAPVIPGVKNKLQPIVQPKLQSRPAQIKSPVPTQMNIQRQPQVISPPIQQVLPSQRPLITKQPGWEYQTPQVIQRPRPQYQQPQVIQRPTMQQPVPQVIQRPRPQYQQPQVIQRPIVRQPAPQVIQQPIVRQPVPQVIQQQKPSPQLIQQLKEEIKNRKENQ